jgi:hypothetical protein
MYVARASTGAVLRQFWSQKAYCYERCAHYVTKTVSSIRMGSVPPAAFEISDAARSSCSTAFLYRAQGERPDLTGKARKYKERAQQNGQHFI